VGRPLGGLRVGTTIGGKPLPLLTSGTVGTFGLTVGNTGPTVGLSSSSPGTCGAIVGRTVEVAIVGPPGRTVVVARVGPPGRAVEEVARVGPGRAVVVVSPTAGGRVARVGPVKINQLDESQNADLHCTITLLSCGNWNCRVSVTLACWTRRCCCNRSASWNWSAWSSCDDLTRRRYCSWSCYWCSCYWCSRDWCSCGLRMNAAHRDRGQ